MTDEQDALDLATAELAEAMVPAPDDVLEDCGPLACLWYLTQAAGFTLGRWAGTIDSPAGSELTDGDAPVQALSVLTQVMGMLNGACVLVDLLPEEAANAPTTP